MQSFQNLGNKIAFAELVSEKISRKLVELIVKDRYEAHY